MALYRILQHQAFDPECIDRLAQAFERSLEAVGASDRSGLLAEGVAKAIIKLAQTGESNPDRLVTQTLIELGYPSDRVTAEQASSDRERSATMLIVDDDEAFAYAAARFFAQLGFETATAAGSFAALRALERKKASVVVTDVRLGNKEPHGVSLARMIRMQDIDMPVILVTAYPELLDLEKPLPGPAFTKPVDLRLLASAVKAVLPH